jgi:hypothetical protein
MPAIPVDFLNETDEARMTRDRAKLLLLSLEIEGLPWEREGAAILRHATEEIPPVTAVERVVLFSGHRIDSPGRANPRFPSQAEPIARAAITEQLSKELREGPITGVAGGANGGDILFLEACHRLNAPYHILLALPDDEFIAASVRAPDGDWEQRFRVLARHGTEHYLSSSKSLPAWLEQKSGYDFWQRNNFWLVAFALSLRPRHFTLIALWNGEGGDGAGGTANMVRVARKHGASFVHLDTRKLFAQELTRTGAP